MAYEFLAGCYDAFTADVHYARWADYLEKHFARSRLPIRTVLDLACGSGRHARYLQSLGLQVTGVDRDQQAIAALQTACCSRAGDASFYRMEWAVLGKDICGAVFWSRARDRSGGENGRHSGRRF